MSTTTRTNTFPWIPLTAMSFAAFVYVTFEMFTVGLITPMSTDLGVSESQIGLLMSVYAGVVAVVTIPAMWFLGRFDKRPVFLATIGFLAAGTLVQAVAFNYGVLVVARIIAALTHGIFWALVAPIAARITPPGHTGKAIGIVSTGSTLALVLGSPLTTAAGGLIGWRWTSGALTIMAVGGLILLLATLPHIRPAEAHTNVDANTPSRWGVPSLVLFLTLVVTGVFTAYTYLGLIVEKLMGAGWVAVGLFAFGACGLVGVTAATRHVDRRMIRGTLVVAAALVLAAIAGEAAFAWAGWLILPAIALWGAAYGALPTVATTYFMYAGRDNPDRASSVYVVTYQVGIASGSAIGAVLVGAGAVSATLWVMALLSVLGLSTVLLWTRPLTR
ncbi:MFS transporter [Corynebacterium renale]|uniref:Putative MFS family arabinose efflux permease n=1 Tax=Corynebacterium renale TaxID=1724 RepID=A0A2A9DLX9_9CORY|nr:MFS transporter [Corynebacterium renale]PFG27708.1 putative MFS family arabinose efflux permease [Corynebacterium renale]SQI22227.1 sugar transporter family protein [Corynebacterium renale]